MVFFSCEISIFPLGHCSWGFWDTPLIFTPWGFSSWEIIVATEPFLPPRRRCQSLKIQDVLRQDSNLITARNTIHPRWKCPLLELKSISEWLFYPSLFWNLSNYFYFFKEKKNVLMHKTLFFALHLFEIELNKVSSEQALYMSNAFCP